MTQALDPGRLRLLRKRRGLTQEALATKAGLSKQTVYRLERGGQLGNRQRSLEGLCRALGVDADVLSGRMPLPVSDQPPSEPSDDSRYQLNVRLDGAVRNAFSLVALRYKIPISRIVELAPLLFVLAAEGSLDRRRAKLAELEAQFEREDELRSNFPHLPYSIAPCFEADDSIAEEYASIENLDIFGLRISDDIFYRFGPVAKEYHADKHNPFAVYLMNEVSKKDGLAEIIYLGSGHSVYRVCQEDASALADGDEELAKCILHGGVLINEMPRELLGEGTTAARIAWMRPKLEEWRARQAEIERL